MKNMKRVSKGFTLIELMIVIAIIAILLALGFAGLPGLHHTRQSR